MTGMLFSVSKEKAEALEKKMLALGIREEDIVEKFIRSGKKGGQNVNKVSSCVYLKHKPSGTEVKCQRERSQNLNRFFARRILVEKIEAAILGKRSSAQKEQERIRRQKRKRSRRAKEKILRDKKILSEKKESRAAIIADLP